MEGELIGEFWSEAFSEFSCSGDIMTGLVVLYCARWTTVGSSCVFEKAIEIFLPRPRLGVAGLTGLLGLQLTSSSTGLSATEACEATNCLSVLD